MPDRQVVFSTIQPHIFARCVGSNAIFGCCFEPADLSFVDSPAYVQSLILCVLHWGILLSTVLLWCSFLKHLCPFSQFPSQNTVFRVQFLPPPCPVLVYHFTALEARPILGCRGRGGDLGRFACQGGGRARWGQGTGVGGGILQHIIYCGHAAGGGTAGSACTRPRVQALENPFLGNRRLGSRDPAPPPPQAAGPCPWACRRQCPFTPHPGHKKAPMPPTRGAWVLLQGAEGTGRRPCRPRT